MFENAALVLVILFVALLAVGIIDGNRFKTVKEEFELSGLSKECRFVLISDLHNKVYTDGNSSIIQAIKKINPDFIVLAGDLVTSAAKEDNTPGMLLIKALSLDYKIYYGLGNHETKIKQEHERFGGKFDQLKRGLEDKNIIFLENKGVNIPEFNIRITGLELGLDYFAHFHKKEMRDGYIAEIAEPPAKNRCNILIAHNPDYFEEYAAWGADLVLSGHVHGGIMRLPLLGGVIAPSYRIFPKYDGGVFREGKSVMLLGRGMGSHTLPFRFFNPAELYEVVLKPKRE